VTALDVDGRDGFAMLTDVLEHQVSWRGQPIWMDPPEQSHWHKEDPAGAWTKADIVANNRLKLEVFRRFGVLPGPPTLTYREFFAMVRERGVGLRSGLGRPIITDWPVIASTRPTMTGGAAELEPAVRSPTTVGRAGRTAARCHRHRQGALAPSQSAQ